MAIPTTYRADQNPKKAWLFFIVVSRVQFFFAMRQAGIKMCHRMKQVPNRRAPQREEFTVGEINK